MFKVKRLHSLHSETRMTRPAYRVMVSLLLCIMLSATLAFSVSAAAPDPGQPKNGPTLNPLLGSIKTASRLSLQPGETLTYTILLHNSSMKAVTVTVVDELPEALELDAASVEPTGSYDASAHEITWEDMEVEPYGEVELTYDVTTEEVDTQFVVNTATITSEDGSFSRSFEVMVGEGEPATDWQRPIIEKMAIGDHDVLTDREVTLHLLAHDDDEVAHMYIREWQFEPGPVPQWEEVQSSGWLPYATELEWTLGDQPGVHYIAAWVGDKEGNTSTLHRVAMDYANLVLPDVDLEEHQMVPCLVHFDKGDAVTAELTSVTGNADLFVWYPGNTKGPNHYTVLSGGPGDVVDFTAPHTGTYLMLVFAMTEATYTLEVTPLGGPIVKQVPFEGVYQPEPPANGTVFTGEPLLSQTGFDPLATGNMQVPASPTVPTVLNVKVFLPTVLR